MGTSDQLARLVRASGINQVEIARRLGVTENWLSNRITGEVKIKADELPRLAEVLGVAPADFFSDVWPPAGSRRLSDTPYADAFIEELSRDLPEAEQEFLRGLITVRRRYQQRLEEESQPGTQSSESPAKS